MDLGAHRSGLKTARTRLSTLFRGRSVLDKELSCQPARPSLSRRQIRLTQTAGLLHPPQIDRVAMAGIAWHDFNLRQRFSPWSAASRRCQSREPPPGSLQSTRLKDAQRVFMPANEAEVVAGIRTVALIFRTGRAIRTSLSGAGSLDQRLANESSRQCESLVTKNVNFADNDKPAEKKRLWSRAHVSALFKNSQRTRKPLKFTCFLCIRISVAPSQPLT